MKKICFVYGTRPEKIKLYKLIDIAKKHFDVICIDTEQHYDKNMSKNFDKELSIQGTMYYLGIGVCGYHLRGERVSEMINSITQIIHVENPDYIIVQGDTDSALAGALAGHLFGVPVGHVEAGLRLGNYSIPEEMNRILIDDVASYLFCPTTRDMYNIRNNKGKKYITGNTIVDAVYDMKTQVHQDDSIFCTLHRNTNVDTQEALTRNIEYIKKISMLLQKNVILSVHPRTQKMIEKYNIDMQGIECIQPLSYKDTLSHLQKSYVVLTDSGGISEECMILGKKCIVLRDSIERDVLDAGCFLYGDAEKDAKKIQKATRQPSDVLGTGHSSFIILDILLGKYE